MEQIIDKLPVLIVDGNYFCHRCVHGLNKGGTFSLNTTLEMMQYEQALYDQMVALYTSFNNNFHTLIGNMIFVFDSHSWRKDVPAHKPYYINDNEKYGYKENRQDAEDGINWDNWRMCNENFQERINKFIAVFNSKGAEGDDSILLLTKFYTRNKILSIVFCTDGDLKQTISKYVVIYKNSVSKEFPKGEMFIDKSIADAYYGTVSPMDKLMGRGGLHQNDRDYLTNLFALEINGGGMKCNIQRTLNNGISVPNHKTDAFVKCIIGDKKDNIFPIFRWKQVQKNGTVNKKVTENMIIKALSPHKIELNDDSLALMLSDTDDGKDLFLNLLLGLQHNTNQVGISKNVTAHYKHNYRMNILSKENLPEFVVENFNNLLKQNLPLVNRLLEYELLLQNNKHRIDDGADILKSSVPIHTTTENQTEIIAGQQAYQNYNQRSSEIDDILNS